MRLRWYRWTVVIVGTESGNETVLPFLRFRHRRQAEEWCDRMNSTHSGFGPDGSTYYEAAAIR